MTARSAAAIASLVLLTAVSACTNFFEVPIETPISAKMDVSAFRRVLVAGFISGGTDDVDANLETVRLLRSQLRSKSGLRVIEAEVLPLAEMAADKAKAVHAARRHRPTPAMVPVATAAADGGAACGRARRSCPCRQLPTPAAGARAHPARRRRRPSKPRSAPRRTSRSTSPSSRTSRSGRRSAKSTRTR